MKPIAEVRRARLRELVTEQGSQVAVADRLQKNKNQVYQWLLDPDKDGSRNISSATAREIETAFSKPVGWMDTDMTQSGTWLADNRDSQPSRPARLDAFTIDRALAMLRALVDLELGKEAVFDPNGDVPLFIAAYNLMAERTLESRSRFDEAMAIRVAAQGGSDGEQSSADPPGERRGN